MKIVNKQQMQAWRDEREMLERRHEEALRDHAAREPQPIEIRKHEAGDEDPPITIKNEFGTDVQIMPGHYYSDNAAFHPDSIEGESDWEIVEQ